MAQPNRTHEPQRISKRVVDAAKPAAQPYIIWDTDIKGFAVKILPSGKKVYLLKYRCLSGIARKPNIGRHGTITADQARSIAKEWSGEVAKGGDPKGDRDQEKIAISQAVSFEETVEDFIRLYAEKRQRTWQQTRRVLLVDCKPFLKRPLTSITRAEVHNLLKGYIAKGTEAKARIALAWLRRLFDWSVDAGLLEKSPVTGLKIYVERKVRDRVFDDDELKAVWQAADRLDPLEGGFCKLIVLLGTRKTELAQMRRSEFDDPLNPTLWIVPHERTKSRKSTTSNRVYVVPLPLLARRIIKSLPKSGDFVFPGRHHDQPMKPAAWLYDKIRKGSGVADWGFHANRHCAATWLENRGYSEYDRGLFLNHASSSVTSGYSHGYPVERKRDLMETWASHIESLMTPEGVALLS